ncbi:MAG: hypothetical protein ABW278_00355 [Steroidobacteraceae bacterium]
MIRLKSFRYCMLIGAVALAGVSVFYFYNYVVLGIALRNSGVELFLQNAIRAMWLSFAFQGLFIALAYALAAYRPHAMTREVIVLLGLLQLIESVLLFSFAGGQVVALLLAGAAVFVLVGSALWPKKLLPPVAMAATAGATPGSPATPPPVPKAVPPAHQ